MFWNFEHNYNLQFKVKSKNYLRSIINNMSKATVKQMLLWEVTGSIIIGLNMNIINQGGKEY